MELFRRFLSLTLLLAVLIGCTLLCSAAESELILQAEQAIIFNAASGEILYSKNTSSPFACGMLPRLMTCLLLLEQTENLTEEVTITREMISATPQISSAELKAGDVLTKQSLLTCILVANSQEACVAVALTVDPSVTLFLKRMNQRAAELGADSTVFTTVHGYAPNNPGQTTMRDVSHILSQLLTHEEVRTISDYRVAKITVNGESKTLYTKNMLVETQSQYYSSLATGLAVSTDGIGACAASFCTNEDNALVSVANSTGSLSDLYPEVGKMLDYSRNEYQVRTLLSKGTIICGVQILQGKQSDQILLIAETSISASVSRHTEDDDIRLIIEAPAELQAPVEKGTVLGTVTVECNGMVCGTSNLLAQTGVSLDYFKVYSDQLAAFFSNKILWLILGGVSLLMILYLFIVYQLNHRKPKKSKRKYTGNRIRPGK